MQSTVKTPAEALKNVTTLVVGQTKGKVKVVKTGQSVSITTCGDAKGIKDCGGQVTVSALMVEGIVSVVTVADAAVSVVVNWVWKVVPNAFVPVGYKLGGPEVISGHGGRVKVRVVLPPFPFDSVTITLGTDTLGVAIKPPLVSPDVILTLENGIPPTIISERVRVRVVIVVKNTVPNCPFPKVVVPVCPYSLFDVSRAIQQKATRAGPSKKSLKSCLSEETSYRSRNISLVLQLRRDDEIKERYHVPTDVT